MKENENNEDNKKNNLNPISQCVKSNISPNFLQEIESGGLTEAVNNNISYTEINNDFLNNLPIESLGINNINNISNFQENKDNEENNENKESPKIKENKEQTGQSILI